MLGVIRRIFFLQPIAVGKSKMVYAKKIISNKNPLHFLSEGGLFRSIVYIFRSMSVVLGTMMAIKKVYGRAFFYKRSMLLI